MTNLDERGTYWLLLRRTTALDTRGFTSQLKAHGVEHRGYAACHQGIYLGLLGQTSDELKEVLGVNNVRDGLEQEQLKGVDIAMAQAAKLIETSDAQGDVACATACMHAAYRTATFLWGTQSFTLQGIQQKLEAFIKAEELLTSDEVAAPIIEPPPAPSGPPPIPPLPRWQPPAPEPEPEPVTEPEPEPEPVTKPVKPGKPDKPGKR